MFFCPVKGSARSVQINIGWDPWTCKPSKGGNMLSFVVCVADIMDIFFLKIIFNVSCNRCDIH